MRIVLVTWACFVLAPASLPFAAAAQEHALTPPTISVAATGNVDYVPDIARMQLGIRAQAASASSAADQVNRTAAQVIAALQRKGVASKSIQTTGYNLEYREPETPPPGSAVQATANSSGSYVASEILQVVTPVKSAGAVLDAGIGAGANTSYGLSYQSSAADVLYREALARAVQSARATAAAIASAAHLTIVRIASISNTGEQGPIVGVAAPMAKMAAAQVLPGTDTMSASIYAVFVVK